MTPAHIPSLTLSNSVSIPQLGFGTYKVDPVNAQRVVECALEVGYRHIDTAQMYGNEREVGRAVAASGLSRDDVFITTKLDNPYHRPADARDAFARSLDALGVERVDLFLIHWPLPTLYGGDFVSTWRVLEDIYDRGQARAIGVSNFLTHHLRTLIEATDIVPHVNQVESHPHHQCPELHEFHRQHGIVTEAWSPLARGRVLDDPTLVAIAEECGKTPAQVALRWAIQRGDVVFPKSTHRERMEANLALFDFSLTDDQMTRISAIDRGEDGRSGSHPDTMDRL